MGSDYSSGNPIADDRPQPTLCFMHPPLHAPQAETVPHQQLRHFCCLCTLLHVLMTDITGTCCHHTLCHACILYLECFWPALARRTFDPGKHNSACTALTGMDRNFVWFANCLGHTAPINTQFTFSSLHLETPQGGNTSTLLAVQ